MKNPALALLRLSTRRPWWVLLSIAGLALLAALGIPRLELRLNARSLIPVQHPALAASDRALEIFPRPDMVAIALLADSGTLYSPEGLALLARLSRELAAQPGIVAGSVVSLATLPRLFVEQDAIDLDPLLARPAPTAETAGRLRREVAALGLDSGGLVAPSGRAAGIYASVRPGTDPRVLAARTAAWLKSAVPPGYRAHLSGTAMAQAELGEASARDLARLVPLVLLIVGAALARLLGSWRLAAIALLEAGISLIWTAGLMGWCHQPVFVTTLVLPAILIVIGVSDDIYALNQVLLLPGSGAERVVAAFSAVALPVLLTSATTVVALLSLAVVGLEPQRVLGLFGSLAVLLSTLLTFTLVPALVVVLDPRTAPAAAGRWRKRLGLRFFQLYRALRARRPGPRAAALAMLALLLLAWGASRLTIDDSWIGNLPPGSPVVAGDEALNRELAGTHTLELLVEAGCAAGLADPSCFAALGRLEARLAGHPVVGAVEGPFGDTTRVLAALESRPWRSFRESGEEGRALSAEQIEQAGLLLQSVRSPLGRRTDASARRGHVTIFLRDASYRRVGEVLRFVEELRQEGGGRLLIEPFGDGWVGYQTIDILVRGQLASIFLAIVLEAALLTWIFGSWSLALWAMAPVVGSVLLVFSLLGASGIQLGVASSMFAAIALGIGVDYSTHLVARWRELARGGGGRHGAVGQAVRATGPPIAISALALALGFSVLMFSEIQPNRQLGALVSLSLLTCAAMTLAIVPLVLRRAPGRAAAREAGSRKRRWALAGALLLGLNGGPGRGIAWAGEPAPAPEVLVGIYNRRDTGATGARRVHLELRQRGETTRSFTVLQLWQQQKGQARSVFLLLAPSGLAGTAYLLTEDASGILAIHLYLPAGSRKVLSVLPSRFHEGLLGSDFAYQDLTWLLHRAGAPMATLPQVAVEGVSAWPLEIPAESSVSPSWLKVRHYLRTEAPHYLGADYFSAAGTQRRLRVGGWEQRQGIWTPTRIVMSAPEGRESVMTLEAALFHLPGIAPSYFEPEALPGFAAAVESGPLAMPLGPLAKP